MNEINMDFNAHKGNSNKNNTSSIWKCWFNMFKNLLQIFNIIFDVQDITLCLKQNHYAFRHLGYSYLHQICGRHNLVKAILCPEGVSGHFHNKSCSFTFFLFQIKETFGADFLFRYHICSFKAVFQLRVFHTYVHARKTLNPFQYYSWNEQSFTNREFSIPYELACFSYSIC